ncbi:hypothetical protein LTR66_016756 [Elasticomyces elasticus]|nr:hypothetical protein LTR66_016756 [Elasticomyces elasticus]
MPVNQELPLTSLQWVVGLTVILLVIWTFLKRRIDAKGSFQWAYTLLESHNFLAASASAVLAAYVLDIGHNVLTARTDFKVDPYVLGYIYHILKIYEYGDIILSLLSGQTQISKHIAFTHLALPFWSLYRIVLPPHDSVDWRFQVITDCVSRMSSRIVPWLVEDARTEETLVNMIDEARWYPDLAINAVWAYFTYGGQRDDAKAIEIFGRTWTRTKQDRLLLLGVSCHIYNAGNTYEYEPAHITTRKQKAEATLKMEH